ncbi:MAG: PKD domain-containing protein [Bacteroidia bacterium]|nr:PKD domain-containing protein [Bacteroidia bacterium]
MRGLQYIVLIVVIVASQGCEKNREPAGVQPVAFFKMSPETGNTTTIFRFNADSVIGQGTRDNPVFVRWDWDSDGIWDLMYSTGGEITHRFYKPGSYRIIMEASTIAGKRDTMITLIEVPRGYSPPRAAFSMNPDSANITTEFTFDASLSKDDEDSLDQLEFRWDFTGDQSWDTEFSRNPVISHRYPNDSLYPVRLEVRDPQQMTSVKTDTLIVTRLNDRIVPVVTHECWPCTIEDTVKFDASGSFYQDRPGASLLFSWDIRSDNLWEATLNSSPYFNKVIGHDGTTKVRVRVTDDQGLYMDFIDSVELFPLNSPPVTRLVIGNRIGNTGSRFLLHVRGSSDRDNSYMDLVAHWDIDNDGIWEPEYDGMYEIWLTFPAPGKYPVTAMMTDPKNKSSMDTDTVWVVAGNHETGILEDKRGGSLPTYYGTVKIGNRWWMQANLNYYPNSKGADWHSGCYNNDSRMQERYGALYPHLATYSNNPTACPTGWHVPTLVEWQQLMADLGPDATVERLMEGGLSEMHVLLAGQKDYSSNSPYSKDRFSGLGQMANFWTSAVTLTGQAHAWYIDPIRKQNKAVIVGKSYWFPIRCIKDE